MTGWLDYWHAVKGRITWDRSVLRGLWLVPFLQVVNRRERPRIKARIAYYPQPAGPWYTMPLALAGTGVRPTKDLSQADVIMIFEDRTESAVILPETVKPLINAGATDISKVYVGQVFQKVFGYPLDYDPRTHQGVMVRKSDVNGLHDGEIVQGPLSDPDPESVYQHLVDSTVRDGVTEDLRCVCVGGEVVQVFRKEKADATRFQAIYLRTTLQEPKTTFNEAELQDIARFCQIMGLDFGSIDILRDYSEGGRLYIVDVNKTCMPVLNMPVMELAQSLRRIGEVTEGFILESIQAKAEG